MASFHLTVFGDAQPAGSKRGFKHPHTGQVIVTDANPKSKTWKGQVAQAAGEHYRGELLDGPLLVAFTFYRPRPRSHYGTGRNSERIKDSSPAYPATRPDVLKLARGVEDALAGIVYSDDARIVTELLKKRWGSPARVEIEIKEL